jgi:hypothetical protein
MLMFLTFYGGMKNHSGQPEQCAPGTSPLDKWTSVWWHGPKATDYLFYYYIHRLKRIALERDGPSISGLHSTGTVH